jgi:hypothetical protein
MLVIMDPQPDPPFIVDKSQDILTDFTCMYSILVHIDIKLNLFPRKV